MAFSSRPIDLNVRFLDVEVVMVPMLSDNAVDIFVLLGFLVVAGAIAAAFLRR